MSNNPNLVFENAYNAYLSEDYHKSVKLYKRLLKMNPEWDAKATIYYNLGLALMSIDKYTEALKCFDRSYNMNQNVENIWNKCLCYLNLKQWDKAMEFFHGRYLSNDEKNITATRFPKLPITQLDNVTQAKGKKLLVLNEQGLGDELLFATQLLKLDEIVESALVQVSPALIDLFNAKYQFKNITLSAFESIQFEEVNQFDCYTGIGSVFSTFYKPHDKISREFERKGNRKIGFCWTTNLKSPNTHKRSIDPEYIVQSLQGIDCELVNMQYGDKYGEMIGCADFKPENFLETWNLLDELDLVITVDTSVAHLAGLKGIDTILLINEHLDWRWKFTDKDDDRYSMFYPMVEIVDVNSDISEIVNEIL